MDNTLPISFANAPSEVNPTLVSHENPQNARIRSTSLNAFTIIKKDEPRKLKRERYSSSTRNCQQTKNDTNKDEDEDVSCFYGCSYQQNDWLKCEYCEDWFHSECARYTRLMHNPIYKGHEIKMHVYCGICLDEFDVPIKTIMNQLEDYALLESFFQRNYELWSWLPIPQDGRSCLNAIWSAHPGPFETLNSFISACFSAANIALDKFGHRTTRNKRVAKSSFNWLTTCPDRLSTFWPKLELQFLWLGLTMELFPDVQLKFYELLVEGGDNSTLQCFQQFPEDAERPFKILLLRWNNVAVRYDILKSK